VLNNTGNIQDDLGEKQKALDSFAQALILARTVGNRRGEAATLNNIGAVYYSKGERRKALTYYLQALPLRRAVGDTGGEAVTLSNIGKVYDDSGEQRKALGWYERAVSVFESIRSVTTIEEIKTGLAEEAALAYERTALLLARMGQTARAFDIIERARARAFLDQLGNIRPNVRKGADAYLLREEQDMGSKIAALEVRLGQELAKTSPDAGEVSLLRGELAAAQRRLEVLFTRLKLTDPEYAALRSVETLRLAEVQKLLNRDTTLLSYFVTPEKTLAFVITRSSFHYVELPVKEAELRVAVSSFRDFASLNELRPGSLAQLSDWLIVPLKQHIKTPLLGVVPYGVLHYLPFAALTDGSGYLSEQYSLFHLPSASVLMFVKGNLPGTRLLALAQSRAEGLTVLGYADEEVETVARIYDTKGFPTGRMSKTDFLKRAGDYDIIHIAAHAELNPSNPLFSRILLMPDGKGGEGGDRLEVREIYNLDLSRTGLVVLSACETQLGPYSEGDDIIGLTRAFAYAGTPSVVASLWAVDDESTSRLMEAFYASLKRGASKAAALRMAQAEVRKKYPHPYYWAGFVLNGDPGGRAVL
jgi:CHAT domain-containing protein